MVDLPAPLPPVMAQNVPAGMVKPAEWPVGWGVLEMSEGGILRRVRNPVVRRMPPDQRAEVILSIAIRRDHHTRYARWRESEREQRVEAGVRREKLRTNEVVDAVFDVLRGERGSVKECLERHRVKQVSEWQMAQLQAMYGTNPDLKIDIKAYYGGRTR